MTPAVDRLAPVPAERILRHEWALATILYVGIAAVYFYPLLPHFSTAILGPPSDNVGYLWTLWWGHGALLGDWAALTFTDSVYFPEGTSLAFHVYSWYNLLVALPLSAFFSLPAVYNLLQLQTFVLAGLGAFALARELTRNSALSLVAGFVYAFNPVHYAYALLHMNSSSIEFIPFFVLFFVRAVRAPSRANVLGAAFFFLMNALCSWYYMVYALLFVGLGYAYLAWRQRRIFVPRVLGTVAAVVGLGLLPLAPWIAFMMRASLSHPGDASVPGHDIFVADLLAFFVPHHDHLLSPMEIVRDTNALYTGNRAGSIAYLGWPNLVLAAVALRSGGPELAKYAWGALAFALLAMGSSLHIAGEILPLPLPTRLLESLPLLSTLRVPNRAMVFVYLFLSVLVAVGLGRLHAQRVPVWRRRVLVWGAVGLIFLDYYTLCTGRTDVDVPAIYAEIPRGGPRVGVLDLPLSPANIALYMAYQSEHEIPIVEGYVGRKLGQSLVDRLAGAPLAASIQQLAESGIRWVVLHKHPPEGAEQTTSLRRSLLDAGATLVLEDADAVLLRVDWSGARRSRSATPTGPNPVPISPLLDTMSRAGRKKGL